MEHDPFETAEEEARRRFEEGEHPQELAMEMARRLDDMVG